MPFLNKANLPFPPAIPISACFASPGPLTLHPITAIFKFFISGYFLWSFVISFPLVQNPFYINLSPSAGRTGDNFRHKPSYACRLQYCPACLYILVRWLCKRTLMVSPIPSSKSAPMPSADLLNARYPLLPL